MTTERPTGRNRIGIRRPYRATPFQKKIMLILFSGGSVGVFPSGRCRVWNKQRACIHVCSISTFLKLKKYLRKTDLGFVIDGHKIRALRRNTWVKKYYLQLKSTQQ